MANLSNLIVSGASRLLNTLYCKDIEIDGTLHGNFTVSSPIISSVSTGTHINGAKGTAIINSTASVGYNMLFRQKSANGVFNGGVWHNKYCFFYIADSLITAGTNSYTKYLSLLDESGNSSFPGTVTALQFSGSGSALTALNASNIASGTLAAARLPTLSRSNTVSAGSVAFAANFPVIDSITTDSYGRVTAVNTKTITLPTNPNTDTKMTQTNTTASANYRVLFSANANDTTETNTGRKSANFLVNPSTGEFFAKGYRRNDITGQTLNINTLNLSTGAPSIVKYIEKTDGGATNITNIPVAGKPFVLDVELIRWASTTDYITLQTFRNASNPANEYVRYCTNGTWGGWTTRVFTDTRYTHPNSGISVGTYRSVTVNAQGHVTAGTNPTTLAGYGITDAAAKTHTHTKSQITDFPTSLPANGGTSTYTTYVNGTYTGSGGKQPPSYIPSGKIRFNMTNETGNYVDWILMDTYTGTDVPYVSAIGLEKVADPCLWIMSGAKAGSSWTVKRRVPSFSSNPVSGQFLSADGTTGKIKASGYTSSSFAPAKATRQLTATATAAGWSASAPYSQTISVSGITSSDTPIIGLSLPTNTTAANDKAIKKAYGCLSSAVTNNGSITLYCASKKPVTNFTFFIKGI